MKHVWILNHYAQAPGGAGGTRHFALARHLEKFGWSASIIAASTEHGSGRQRLAVGQATRLDRHDGVSFLWLRTRDYLGNGVRRILNMVDYTWGVLDRRNLEDLEKPDVIIGSSVHPLAAWAGRWLAKRYNVPFVFEVRDLWPQTLIDMGHLSYTHPAAMLLRWLEKSLYRSARRIIVLLPKADSYIAPLGIDPGKIVWVPNGVDLEQFPTVPRRTNTSKFNLMYFGSIGVANDLNTLLRAMCEVQNTYGRDDVELRLIGEGPEKRALELLANGLELRSVKFDPAVPKSDIPQLAGDADAFIICVRNLPGLYRFGISMNKIYDYMAGERPTIISVDAANNPVAEAGCGLSVPPEDPKALARAIIEMADISGAERQRMGQAGRKYVTENHDMKMLSKRLAATLDECVAEA